MRTRLYPYLAFIVFAIPSVCTLNYALNDYFVNGTLVRDTAWFSYMAANSTRWPMINIPILGGDFFANHIAFFFYPTTWLFQFINLFGANLNSSVYYSWMMGLTHGIMSVSIFAILTCPTKQEYADEEENTVLFECTAMVLAIVASMNGYYLSAMGSVHYEMMIPAGFLLFIALYFNGHTKWAVFVALFSLTLREDVGFHFFSFTFLTVLSLLLLPGTKDTRRIIRFLAVLSAIFFVYSAVITAYQKLWFGNDSPMKYLITGEVPYAHLSAEFLRFRFLFMIKQQIFVLLPLALSFLFGMLYGVWKGNPLYMVGAVAPIPWMIFLVTAAAEGPALNMYGYYTFPLIISVVWPVIAYQTLRTVGFDAGPDLPLRFGWPSVVILASIIPFVFGISVIHYLDQQPWKSFGFQWRGKVLSAINGVNHFIDVNRDKMYFLFDESTYSMLDNQNIHLWAQIMYYAEYHEKDIERFDTIIYLKRSPIEKNRVTQKPDTLRNIKFFNLNIHCHIDNSNFYVATRVPGLEGCTPIDHSPDEDFLARQESQSKSPE
jgi:hypothetical protein